MSAVVDVPPSEPRERALGEEPAGVVPAFQNARGEIEWPTAGLTKREYFAAAALRGLLAADADPAPHTFAKLAVTCADALLTELAKS